MVCMIHFIFHSVHSLHLIRTLRNKIIYLKSYIPTILTAYEKFESVLTVEIIHTSFPTYFSWLAFLLKALEKHFFLCSLYMAFLLFRFVSGMISVIRLGGRYV